MIFTVGSPLNLDAARKVTSTVPIVMAGGFIDIIGTGIVQSLARPGGNVTGMAATSDAIPGKRLQLLQQSFPAMVRVGFLFEPGASSQAANDDLLAKAAQSLKLELSRYEVRASTEFEAALQRARMANVDALYVGGSTLLSSQHARGLAELLIKYKFASMAYWNNMADSGFLMGYSASIFDLYNRSALYIDKIFRGANPAVLSIKEPSRYEFAVNLKTAKLIGVTISQDVLLRADRVID